MWLVTPEYDKKHKRKCMRIWLSGHEMKMKGNLPQLQLYIRLSPLTSQTQICTWCPHMQTVQGLSFLMNHFKKKQENKLAHFLSEKKLCNLTLL